MSSILIQAWTVHKSGDEYYLTYTHWIYLKEIVKYYDSICLLSPTKINMNLKKEEMISIKIFENVTVKELPYSNSYMSTVKFFFKYLSAYKNVNTFDVNYVRYPAPFGWLQKIFMKKSKRIIHFVGDPIDTIKKNPNLSSLKKIFLIFLFIPEFLMYMWACKKALVYANGFPLAKKLKKYGVEATPIISSTLKAEDFHFDKFKKIDTERPKIVYVGYLRKAKGVDTVINSFCYLQKNYPNAELTIVGSGESEQELKEIIKINNIKNVYFLGHIDSREKLNTILRKQDIFCFASLSEGSPRVILEAMANGINVVSTPVGSLPTIFRNNENILFADFHDTKMFSDKMNYLINNQKNTLLLRQNAFEKVKNFKIEIFLKEIFYES